MSAEPPSRRCANCGLSFVWRRKWAANWAQIRYCSQRCRRSAAQVDQIEVKILTQLEASSHRLDLSQWPQDRRLLMDAARRLALKGRIELWWQCKRVEVDQARWPVSVSRR